MIRTSLTRIDNKIDNLDARLSAIDVILSKQHEQFVYHIKRTDILEAQVKPFTQANAFVTIALKLLGVIGILSTIVKLWL